MKIKFSLYVLIMVFSVTAQNTNNAANSGNWNECATWNFPGYIYNSDQNEKTILPGVVVTQNQLEAFSGKITLSGSSKIVLPDNNHKISFVGSGTDWDCESSYIDNVIVDFNDNINAKSLSGFLLGMSTKEEAHDMIAGASTYPNYSQVTIDNKIVPLKPKLFRQGNPKKYQISSVLTQTTTLPQGRVHMVMSDSWGRRCWSSVPPDSITNFYYDSDFGQLETDYNHCSVIISGDTIFTPFKEVPILANDSPDLNTETNTYNKFLNKWLEWGQNKTGVVWECWNEPDYPEASWESQDVISIANTNDTISWVHNSLKYWPKAKRSAYFNTYKKLYRKFSASTWPISKEFAGPSLAFFSEEHMTAFFDFCLKYHLEVNVVTWHELESNFNINAMKELKEHVDFVRNNFMNNPKYDDLNIKSIEINEIVFKNYRYNPAIQAYYLNALEQAKVDYACKTSWEDNPQEKSSGEDNRLDNLFNRSGDKMSNWWVYKLYADGVDNRVKSYNEETRSFVIANNTTTNPPTPTQYAQVLFGFSDIDWAIQNTPLGNYKICLKNVNSIMPGSNQGTQFKIRIKKIINPGFDETLSAPEDYDSLPEIDYQNVYNNTNPGVPTGEGPYTMDSNGNITLIINNIERENLYQLAIFKQP